MPSHQKPTAEEIREIIEGLLTYRHRNLGFDIESLIDSVRIDLALRHSRAGDAALHQAVMAALDELVRGVVYLDQAPENGIAGERRPRQPLPQEHNAPYTARFARRFSG